MDVYFQFKLFYKLWLASNNFKFNIEGWKTCLSKINYINEKHFLAFHIHVQNQKNEHNMYFFRHNVVFMWTHYNKFAILENVLHCKRDKTLFA